jgi:hypothetical protein
MIRVLLAEDQAMVRGALAALLSLKNVVVGTKDELRRATPSSFVIHHSSWRSHTLFRQLFRY